MTLFMNFRERAVGGATTEPTFLEGFQNGSMRPVSEDAALRRANQRDILFATHGFNVSRPEGICSLSRLEIALGLPTNCLFIGVLWPGDFWLPVINYPFEGETAMDCGRRLARFCDRRLSRAASLSFVTHSLGARLALEAAQVLRQPVRSVCLTAAAINNDCLTTEYAGAFKNSAIVSVLASRRDLVLKLAFPIGDPIADLLHGDHKFFTPALGYGGPPTAVGSTVPPWQIHDKYNYNHSDYMPPSDSNAPFSVLKGPWVPTKDYIKNTFLGLTKAWPWP